MTDAERLGWQEEVKESREPINDFFGLTYASYLVIPRTALQSMHVQWQRKFVGMIHQIEELLADYEPSAYWVRRTDGHGKFLYDPLADYERGRRRLTRRKK
jgi:hypothetical protein